MAFFDVALRALLEKEGGYAPEDNGRGAVNGGITQATLDDLGIKKKAADLTYADKRAIYLKHFWTPHRLGEIHDQQVAETLFEAIVNMGPVRPIKYVQEATNGVGGQGLHVDGRMGFYTVEAINRVINKRGLARELEESLKDHLEAEYRRMATRNPEKYGDDLNGWLGRIGRAEKKAKANAAN